jgi:hypothetical protein
MSLNEKEVFTMALDGGMFKQYTGPPDIVSRPILSNFFVSTEIPFVYVILCTLAVLPLSAFLILSPQFKHAISPLKKDVLLSFLEKLYKQLESQTAESGSTSPHSLTEGGAAAMRAPVAVAKSLPSLNSSHGGTAVPGNRNATIATAKDPAPAPPAQTVSLKVSGLNPFTSSTTLKNYFSECVSLFCSMSSLSSMCCHLCGCKCLTIFVECLTIFVECLTIFVECLTILR